MRQLILLFAICLLFGCGGGEEMKVIKPIEFSVDASTIDIDSDGYGEWESGTPLDGIVVTGNFLNPYIEFYTHTSDNLAKLSDFFDIIPSFSIRCIEISHDRKYLFAGTELGKIYVYKRNVNTLTLIDDIGPFGTRVYAMSYRNSCLVVSVQGPPYLLWFKLENEKLIRIQSPSIFSKLHVTSVKWISDNICMVNNAIGNIFVTFYTRIGNTIQNAEVEYVGDNRISLIDVLNNPNEIVLCGNNDPRVRVYSFNDDELISIFTDAGQKYPISVAFSPNGDFFAVCGSDMGVRFLHIYQRGSDNLWVKLTDPATQPPSAPNAVYWDASSTYLFMGLEGAPHMYVYKRSGTTLTRLALAIDTDPSSAVFDVGYFPASGYLQGDIIRRGNDLYESLMNDNQSNDPATEVSTSPTWLNLGKVNRHRMFDDKLSTLSIQPGTTGQSYTLNLNSATEGFFTLTHIEEYEWKYGTAFGQVSENIRTFSFPHDVTASTLQSTLEAVYGKGLVTVTAATDFTIAFDPVIGDARLHLGTYALGGATPTLTMPQAFVTANLVVTLTPLEAGSDHVYLFGLDATSVTIQHFESNGTTQVSTSGAIDVTDKKSTSRALTRAMTANEKIKITIANTATTAKCGKVIIGESVIEKAKTQWGITPEIKSYGRRNIDDFGQAYLKKGNVAKKVRASCILDSDADADEIFEVLNQLDNLPAVYDFNGATTTYSTLHFYGIYLDGRMPFQGLNHTKLTLDILGLI